MKITNVLITIVMLAISNAAWSMNWLPVNNLDNLRIDKVGSIYGNTVSGASGGGCATTGFTIPNTQVGFDAMLSVLLSALAAQRDVQLSVSECISGNTLVVDGVRINN